jgi:Domain of unknown function (DUF4337)
VKATIPEDLKRDLPATTWGKTLSATPVVMTIVATLLAGLASSEMTKAQYDRALGAQLQSKAGDQWSYFQAKKMRGAMQRNSIEMLEATAEIRPINNPALEKVPAPAPLVLDAGVEAAMQAVEKQKPEVEIVPLLKQVNDATLAAALQSAKDNALAFETASAPANQALEKLEKSLTAGDRAMSRDFTVARMRFNGSRYDIEARLNQSIANIYELQVRKANISAERHHRRSGKFFFGMLAAQAAVIIATLAIAAQKRNFLWSIAAFAGITAIVFAVYVYLRV